MVEPWKNKYGSLAFFYASSNLVKKINVNDFQEYVEQNGFTFNNNVFNGFLFLNKTIFRNMLSTIVTSNCFNIDEDFYLHRAWSRGIELHKLHNTCDKIIFLKNLFKVCRKLWSSKHINDYKNNYSNILNYLINPIMNTLEKNVELNSEYDNLNIDELINNLSTFYAYTSLQDTSKGFPIGYINVNLKLNLTEIYMSQVFTGYKLSLLYIWEKILKVEDTYIKEKMLECKNWSEIDDLWEYIRNNIIIPLDKKCELTLYFGEYFIIKEEIENVFPITLFKPIEEPILLIEEELRNTLLWYPIQALGKGIFNEVATFISVMSGNINIKEIFNIQDKTKVIRFIHPENVGNRYSYAILVEAFGSIADYSGWLIFVNCATDFSGFGGSSHATAEKFISLYNDQQKVDIVNFEIDLNDINSYVASFSLQITDNFGPFINKTPTEISVKEHKKLLEEYSIDSKYDKIKSLFGMSKGMLLELIFHYYFTSEKENLVRWRYRNKQYFNNEEIDLIVRNLKEELLICSCMVQLSQNKIDRLNEQYKIIINNFTYFCGEFGQFKTIKKIVILYDRLNPLQRNRISFDGIILSLTELMSESSYLNRLKKDQIKAIFDYDEFDPNKLY